MRSILPLLIVAAVFTACPATNPAVTDAGSGGGGGGGGAMTGGGGGSTTDAGVIVDAGTDECGDGERAGVEACDDGARVSGDGCSITCGVESGWFCPFPPAGQPSRCEPTCGDGRLITEPCDDGNARNGDGCSNTCNVEPGYTCSGAPSLCVVSCGDGSRGGNEQCDDGNVSSNDGCSSTCQAEVGFACNGTPSVCRPLCGDRITVAGEACDDGFLDACGTCNAFCTGPGLASQCGDGTRCPETEQCDDMNVSPGDGCSANCLTEIDGGVAPVDSGVPDSGMPVDAGQPVDAGMPGMGAFTYQAISNITFTNDFTRVVWHPSGRFALLLASTGRIVRYEPSTKTIVLAQQIATTASLTDIAVANDGSFFLVVGQLSSATHLWRIDVGGNDVLASAVDVGTLPSGTGTDLDVEPGTNRFAIGARGASLINYLYVWPSPDGGMPSAKGYNNPGNFAVLWGSPAIYSGSANVLTSDGVNGAGSQTWVENSNLFVANNWGGGFGNPGRGAWVPGGPWGAFVGWSSNKLYAFDGTWHLVTLPGNTGISPQSIAFRADGQRGLVVGRPVGAQLTGTVIEYRPVSPGSYDDSSFVNVSIPAFSMPPWNGNSNQYLLDVAFRPGACDEGLIVGMDNGSSVSPTFGLAVRFYDSSQSTCSP